MIARTLLVAGAATILSGQLVAAEPATKGFRDWVAGCDNLKGCTALSLPADMAETVAFLKLERAGGAAQPRLSLRIRAEGLKQPQAVQLSLDGLAFPAAGRTLAVTTLDEDSASIALSPDDAEALISAARKATTLTASLAGKRYRVSLAGSVAAMLWIDEQQGRLGADSALIRKGNSSSVPQPPSLPVIQARASAEPALDAKAAKTLAAALRKTLGKADAEACEAADEIVPDSIWPLGGGLRLVGLVCSRGAYNINQSFWTVPGNDVAKARKVRFGDGDNALTNADFDPKTGQISYFAKARGLGDCGVAGGYAWIGTGFAMTALSEMGECRQIGPEDWPVLFRSEVRLAKP